MNAPRRRAMDRLRSVSLIAVALLTLGVGGHLWHHLSDPDCESPARGPAHPCSLCTSLHSSALAEESRCGAAPSLSPSHPLHLPEALDAASDSRRIGSPRGPPLA